MFKPIVKWLGFGIIALIALAIATPFLINTQQMKMLVEKQLLVRTGYIITMNEDISVRLLPTSRLHLSDVSIATPQNKNKPFATMKALDVGANPFKLLTGQLQITSLSLKTPNIHLIQSGNDNNWEPTANNKQTSAQSTSKNNSNITELLGGLTIGDISITDGTIHYRDTTQKTSITLEQLKIAAEMPSLQKPLSINLSALFNKKPLNFEGKINSLGMLLSSKEAQIKLEAKSDLLNVAFDGTLLQTKLQGKVKMQSDSVLDISHWIIGDSTASEKVLAVALTGEANCAVMLCNINNVRAKINDSEIDGKIALDISGSTPSISADLSSELLDVSPYLAKKTADSVLISSAHAAENSQQWSTAPIDLTALQAFNASIALKVNRFVAGAFETGKATFRAKNTCGSVSAELVDTSLYQGTANIFINMAANGKIDGRSQLDAIQLEPLLNATSEGNRISGALTGQFAFNSLLKSVHSLIANLNASGKLSVADGSIKGVDLAGMVRNIQSAYKNVDTSQQKTDFAEMGGTFTIANGIVTNNDFAMKAPLFRVSGKGTIDLPAYTLNYRLTPQIVETIQGQGGKDKQGLAVPILVTGSLNNPSYTPDAQGMLEDALKNPDGLKNTINDVKGLFKKPKATDGAATDTATPAPKNDKPMNQIKDLLKF